MPETRWLDQDEQRAWRAYLEATQLLIEQLDRELHADAGVSHADYEIFVRLSEAPDRRMRMCDLAAHTLFSRSRLSHAVARLEHAGWVTRAPHPTDKRGTVAELTDAGWAKLVQMAPGHVTGVRRHLLDPLTREQVESLRAIGEAVAAPLRAADPTRNATVG